MGLGTEVCGEGAGVRRGGSGYTSLSQLSGMAAAAHGYFPLGRDAPTPTSVRCPRSPAAEDARGLPRLRRAPGAREAPWNLFPRHAYMWARAMPHSAGAPAWDRSSIAHATSFGLFL